jgi:hypothetical protein
MGAPESVEEFAIVEVLFAAILEGQDLSSSIQRREAGARSVATSGFSTSILPLVLRERRYGENIQKLGIPFAGGVIFYQRRVDPDALPFELP